MSYRYKINNEVKTQNKLLSLFGVNMICPFFIIVTHEKN